MEKTIGQPKKVKTKSGRVGSFFLGWFVGFLVTIALLAGLFSFVYFKVSANWINKHFKAGINLPYDLNSMTISDVVNGAINLGKNLDSYTLEDLKKDFGINVPDELFKIDISDLKVVSFKELANKIGDKFESISAQEIENVIAFPKSIKDFLTEHSNDYYVQGTTLFTDSNCQTAVSDFKYEIVNNEVHIKNFYKEPVNYAPKVEGGKVSIHLYYLPIKIAFTGLDPSGDMTLADLESYGFQLPTFLSTIPSTTHLNELGNEIEKLQIASIMGYDIEGGKVYKTKPHIPDNEASSLESFIAQKTIAELKSGEGLSLTLENIFEPEEFEKPGSMLYILNEHKKDSVDKLPTLLGETLGNATLGTLKNAGIISVDLEGKKIAGQDLANIKINDLLDIVLKSELVTK